ncbi:hypothetical protein GJ496_009908 [Pomphorhynchus laevis]|nr:hypothetical protein GJ496_009908 [Pomphorhynchus laevis]
MPDYIIYCLVLAILKVTSSFKLPINDKLQDIKSNLQSCESQCDLNDSCIQGCRKSEDMKSVFKNDPTNEEINDWCSQLCNNNANPDQCIKGCKMAIDLNNNVKFTITRIRIFRIPTTFKLFNSIFGHAVADINKDNLLNDNNAGNDIISHINAMDSEGTYENGSDMKPLCNKVITFKQWRDMNQMRLNYLNNGALEIWLLASLLILMSTTLWLMIWLKQLRQRRVFSLTEKIKNAENIEKDESLPEYNTVVENVQV